MVAVVGPRPRTSKRKGIAGRRLITASGTDETRWSKSHPAIVGQRSKRPATVPAGEGGGTQGDLSGRRQAAGVRAGVASSSLRSRIEYPRPRRPPRQPGFGTGGGSPERSHLPRSGGEPPEVSRPGHDKRSGHGAYRPAGTARRRRVVGPAASVPVQNVAKCRLGFRIAELIPGLEQLLRYGPLPGEQQLPHLAKGQTQDGTRHRHRARSP